MVGSPTPNGYSSANRATRLDARLHRLVARALCLAIALLPPVAVPNFAMAETQKESSAGAKALVRAAERAVAYTVKTARDSKDANLDTKNPKAKQFWQAMQKLNIAVDKTERGLFLKDKTFFASMADASSAVQEAKVALEMSGANDTEVSGSLDKVERAVNALRENYSLEARRKDSGAPLNAAEKRKLEELKKKQGELDAKLAQLEKKVKKNKKQLEGVKHVRRQSRHIHDCHYDAGGFFAAMLAWSVIDGLI